jgi:hypothetical protein
MTLPLTDLKFSQINSELGRTSTASYTLDDIDGRKLASVGNTGQNLTLGTDIKISNFLGHARSIIVISSDAQDVNVLNKAITVGYSSNKSYVTMTVNPGIYVGSSVVTSPAVAISGFGSYDLVEIVNNGAIVGAGGGGGNGSTGGNGSATAGQNGGTAISANQYVSVINNGLLAGGGGGGGGCNGYSQQQGFFGGVARYNGGGGGGGGGYNSGAGGNFSASGGTRTAGGLGGRLSGGAGGNGGNPGQAGQAGYQGGEATGKSAGLAGYYVNGSTYVTLSGANGSGRII